jgi:CRP-like cAMP-binding protein
VLQHSAVAGLRTVLGGCTMGPFQNNRILSALAARNASDALLARLVPVRLNSAQVLVTASTFIRYGFFITEGMACHLTVMKNGVTTAAEIIGPEGFVGLPLTFGKSSAQPVTVACRIAGTAMRIDADVFLNEFNKRSLFRDLMRRYTSSRMASIIQTAACNGVHSVPQRMACWLLRISDRVGSDFKLTHETFAQMLGNRRATVTAQAEAFEGLGYISYRYGRIRIENRRDLETIACECYDIHRKAVEDVFNF